MRYELSDHEWTAIKPMLPNKPRGVRRVNDRRVLNGIPIQKSQVLEFSVPSLTGGGFGNLAGRSIGLRSPSRIFAGHPWNSRIRPRVYRPFEFVIPGTTDAADEMVRHIRHRQPLRQSERQWLDIEMTGWPAGRAFDLEEFAVPGEIAESYRAIGGGDRRRLMAWRGKRR